VCTGRRPLEAVCDSRIYTIQSMLLCLLSREVLGSVWAIDMVVATCLGLAALRLAVRRASTLPCEPNVQGASHAMYSMAVQVRGTSLRKG
jgi:hypothetical protein